VFDSELTSIFAAAITVRVLRQSSTIRPDNCSLGLLPKQTTGKTMEYTSSQIEAAKKQFELHKIAPATSISNERAIKFLNFYFAQESRFPCNSVEKATEQGLLHGRQIMQQEAEFMR